MEKNISKTVLILLGLSDLLLVFFIVFLFYKNALLEKEVVDLKGERIRILEEHGECLKFKEISLKKELVEKYMESMISLRNKIEKGHVPDKGDLDSFFDRSGYIIDNLEIYEPSKEKITQYLLFIGSMKTLLEPFTGKTEKNTGAEFKKN